MLFLSYVDEDHKTISFLHAFADAEAMDVHFEGSGERARAARDFIEPIGWEFYGHPSAAALETMRRTAVASRAALDVHPEYVTGFLRLERAEQHGMPRGPASDGVSALDDT